MPSKYYAKDYRTGQKFRTRSALKKGKFEYMRKNRKFFKSVPRARGATVTGEMKYFDTEQTGQIIAGVTTTWVAGTRADPVNTINLGDPAVVAPLCLFAPKVSANLNGRIGRKVFMHKIRIKGIIELPEQNAMLTLKPSIAFRLVLLLDKQTNAATINPSDVFNDTTGSGNTTINSAQNPNHFGRFKILKDKFFSLTNFNIAGNDVAATNRQSGQTKPFKMSYNFKPPMIVNFNSQSTGSIAMITDNALHLICAADDNSYGALIYYYSRVCYKE